MNTEKTFTINGATIRLINGNSSDVVKGLEKGSVNTVITDPPYLSTDLDFDKNNTNQLWFDIYKHLKSEVLPDIASILMFCDTNLYFNFRQAFPSSVSAILGIWIKRKGTNYLSTKHSLYNKTEYIAKIKGGKKAYGVYNSAYKIVDKTITTKPETKITTSRLKPQHMRRFAQYHNRLSEVKNSPKILGNIYTTEGTKFYSDTLKNYHPTQKPVDVCYRLVREYSSKGDTILDPFMGAGATALASALAGRNYIGVELNTEYFNHAAERLELLQHWLQMNEYIHDLIFVDKNNKNTE